MAVTMKDIAQDLGISLITVSKVMRKQPDVSAATRKRVLERAKELNYIPNLAARALVTGRTYLVGLVVPDLLHTFFAEIAKSLSKTLLKKGYCLTISTSDENPDVERDVIDHLLARKPDALIIASAATQSERIERIQREGTPVVLIDRCFPGVAAHYIGADDAMLGFLATEHLLSIGCRRIAHLRGPDTSPGIGRLNGYLRALAKHRVESLPGYISDKIMADVHSRENGAALMKKLLALEPHPDGIFCYNDPMAIGAINTILAAGLRVPEDIAVIGAGNLNYDGDLRISLSSMDQQTNLVGEHAAKLALALIESRRKMKPKTFIVQPRLVVRASTEISSMPRGKIERGAKNRCASGAGLDSRRA